MELDDLKSDWNTIEPISKSDESLLLMLKENKHPVLKSIRIQIRIEVTAWSLFLIGYYSMFDGVEKPLWVNLTLILAVAMPIFHSLYGYYYNKYLTDDSNIKDALDQLYNRLKKFALFSIISRLGFIYGLLLFFTYAIHFTTTKYILLGFIAVVVSVQLFVLYCVWAKRLSILKNLIKSFSTYK
jgi:hypothetical protein